MRQQWDGALCHGSSLGLLAGDLMNDLDLHLHGKSGKEAEIESAAVSEEVEGKIAAAGQEAYGEASAAT